MSYHLIIFVDPLEGTSGELVLDNGTKITSHPAEHSTGRKGLGFSIPETSPNQNGCTLTLTHDKKVTIKQRAILSLQPSVGLLVDDYYMADEKVCPEVPVPIPPNPNPPVGNDPLGIINEVYKSGKFNLITKESCGLFTEACVNQLHTRLSTNYGHLKKSGAQNQFNGHAVDAINLKSDYTDVHGKVSKAGIYDIIISSESLDAKPAYNKAEGESTNDNWFYPANTIN